MDRTAWLRHQLPEDEPGVEIGPLDRAIMPRPGTAVLYADHLDNAGLKAKYAAHDVVDVEAIPHVDFVIGAEGLAAAVGDRRVRYVIASHVIEHVPNPIAWLADIHGLLADGGVALLAIPDLRRCFDALRRESTPGEWVEAYLGNHSRPSPSRIFDAFSNEVKVGGAISWHHDPDPADMVLSRDASLSLQLARDNLRGSDYLDVHCWTFTAATFCNLMRKVASAGLLELKLDSITDTMGHEFLVRLRRDDAASRSDIVASYPARGGRYDLLPGDFDAVGYCRLNPDIAASSIDPNDHYIQHGRREQRAYR